jgi:hypothetical protein
MGPLASLGSYTERCASRNIDIHSRIVPPVSLVVNMARQARGMNTSSAFRVSPVPDLGLNECLSYPLRVYVLGCEGACYYVGIAPKEKIGDRILEQFGGATHFCEKHPPQEVLCVWPAASEAIEAAMFFGMQKSLGGTLYSKLGGWTQTSSKLSPLVVMQMEQSRRQLMNRCFECGGSHASRSTQCPGSSHDCFYSCIACGARNNISSRGQTRVFPPTGSAAAVAATAAGAARAAAPTKAAPPRPAPPADVAAAAPATPAATPAPKATVLPVAAPKAAAAAANAPAVRKRPACEAFSHTVPPLSFDQCWEHASVRKKGRYASTKDLLRVMSTVKAGRASPTIGQRVAHWSKSHHWPDGAYKPFREFGARTGGGALGTGCLKSASRDIYALMSGS